MEQPFQSILIARSARILLQSPNDFRLYRLKTSKNLAKLRRDLKIQQKTPKGNGQSHNKGGKSLYKQKDISENDLNTNEKLGNVLLLLAETCWAHAMETKAVLETNPSSEKRKRVVSKLKKSLSYAKLLSESIKNNESISDLTKLEIYTYVSLIEGGFYFEKSQWNKAVESYSTSRVLLIELLNNTSKELINDLISTTVDPALAFAYYKTGNKRSTDLPTLAKLSVKNDSLAIKLLIEKFNSNALEVSDKSNPTVILGDINWRNYTATVSDPDLASQILSAQKLDSNLQNQLDSSTSSKSINLFDDSLQGWQECLDLIKESIDKIETSKESSHDEKSSQTQYIILTYINYNLLLRRIQRDKLFVEQLSNKKSSLITYRDVIRIYDTILQSVLQLIELPGVHNDEVFSNALSIVQGYFKAQRTFLIAKSYRLIDEKKESLALFELANKFVSFKNVNIINDANLPNGLVTAEEINQLINQLKVELVRAHGIALLDDYNSTPIDNTTNTVSISDDLTVYPKGKPTEILNNLVNFNPQLKSIPIKPVFFDIAYNYVDYDDTTKNAVLSTTTPPKPSTSTPTTSTPNSGTNTPRKSFFGGLLGRG